MEAHASSVYVSAGEITCLRRARKSRRCRVLGSLCRPVLPRRRARSRLGVGWRRFWRHRRCGGCAAFGGGEPGGVAGGGGVVCCVGLRGVGGPLRGGAVAGVFRGRGIQGRRGFVGVLESLGGFASLEGGFRSRRVRGKSKGWP